MNRMIPSLRNGITLHMVALAIVACYSSHSTDTETDLTQAELQTAISIFKTEKGEWETLQSAFSVEVRRTGSFQEIGFTPDSANQYWEFQQSGNNFGDLKIRNKVKMEGCGKGQEWHNVYVFADDSFILAPPSKTCDDILSGKTLK